MSKLSNVFVTIGLAGVFSTAQAWDALPTVAPAPIDNPTTPAKVALGKMLYHDPRLSSTGTVSCASCHNVMLGGEDNRPFAFGVNGQLGDRSAPTVWNAAFNISQFWDGRAASLEAQAAGPVTNPIEMGMPNWDAVVARLKTINGYVVKFNKVFGKDSLSKETVTKAIAAYERTLITPNSGYDRYAKGDVTGLTPQQISGLNKMQEVGCLNCHTGATFGGTKFEKFPKYDSPSLEQYNFAKDMGVAEVTKKTSDEHLFKVPTLRNIALTAPYFHNGAVKTLKEAIAVNAQAQLNKTLTAQEIDDIAAFLEGGLTGKFPNNAVPQHLPATPQRTFN